MAPMTDLTPAQADLRRHALVERLLADVLRVPWSQVHQEAERFDGVISAEVEERLVDLLGDPGVCPHGNPIPGATTPVDLSGAGPLSDQAIGPAVVVRVLEALEDDALAMRELEAAGLTPGRDLEVVGRDDDGTVLVAGAVADARLPAAVARLVHVRTR